MRRFAEGLPRPNPDKDSCVPKFLSLGVERPTEKLAIDTLIYVMYRDGYFD